MTKLSTRSGTYIQTTAGYQAFIPAALPPHPPLIVDSLLLLLSEADRALGRLDGVTSILPNPDLFVAMYVRQEAVLSSQIEGTQSTLEDVLQFEMDGSSEILPKDIEEVVNYVRAMNQGIERLKTLPLSLRLIRELHATLLENVRGSQRTPGEFRTTQNWIGSAGCSLKQATFVPPHVEAMHTALNDFEQFLHDTSLPTLIQCGLVHAQFETIHPFMDGNGRIGRLLITLLLCERAILHQPLLYLSYYLKQHRAEYYDRLMAIRHAGDWEGWLTFFLKGIIEVSHSATTTARAILALREQHRQQVIQELGNSINSLKLLDYLFHVPLLTVRTVEQQLSCSFVTASRLIEQFVKLGILYEITGAQRHRRYRYESYLRLFEPSLARIPTKSHDSTQPEFE